MTKFDVDVEMGQDKEGAGEEATGHKRRNKTEDEMRE